MPATTGDGLGRNNDGITAALRPKFKFDNAGLGHSKADEMNNHWWENVYNNAATNMDVSTAPDGAIEMKCRTGKSIEITTKNYTVNKKADEYYKGQFLRTSTLVNASKEVRNAKKRNNSSDSSDDDDDSDVFETVTINPFKVVSDADLLKACEGRTAHK